MCQRLYFWSNFVSIFAVQLATLHAHVTKADTQQGLNAQSGFIFDDRALKLYADWHDMFIRDASICAKADDPLIPFRPVEHFVRYDHYRPGFVVVDPRLPNFVSRRLSVSFHKVSEPELLRKYNEVECHLIYYSSKNDGDRWLGLLHKEKEKYRRRAYLIPIPEPVGRSWGATRTR